jgi:metal-sulfur cluster biosynthetic enzyme
MQGLFGLAPKLTRGGTKMDEALSGELPREDEIIAALKKVEDPDLFLDIWFLGLIYSIDIGDDGAVGIEMTFTTPLCPSGPYLTEMIKQHVGAVPGVIAVSVTVVFTPPWEPSEEVKMTLGLA